MRIAGKPHPDPPQKGGRWDSFIGMFYKFEWLSPIVRLIVLSLLTEAYNQFFKDSIGNEGWVFFYFVVLKSQHLVSFGF